MSDFGYVSSSGSDLSHIRRSVDQLVQIRLACYKQTKQNNVYLYIQLKYKRHALHRPRSERMTGGYCVIFWWDNGVFKSSSITTTTSLTFALEWIWGGGGNIPRPFFSFHLDVQEFFKYRLYCSQLLFRSLPAYIGRACLHKKENYILNIYIWDHFESVIHTLTLSLNTPTPPYLMIYHL